MYAVLVLSGLRSPFGRAISTQGVVPLAARAETVLSGGNVAQQDFDHPDRRSTVEDADSIRTRGVAPSADLAISGLLEVDASESSVARSFEWAVDPGACVRLRAPVRLVPSQRCHILTLSHCRHRSRPSRRLP